MKNRHIEYLKRLAKQAPKNWDKPLSPQGNYLYHCYSEPKTLGWWDDVSFKLGSQRVVVWWVHPRMAYYEICENMAYDMVDNMVHIQPKQELHMKVVQHKQLGRSRKKAVSYQFESSVAQMEWEQAVEDAQKKILQNNELIIKPYIHVKQYGWGLGVNLCLPMEVVDQDSVEAMAHIAKRLLRHETSLAELFSDYVYSKENWQQEEHF